MMRNHAPLVSIVVITYNSREYILDALNSILIQSYHHLELIIADDCSSDDTVKICRNWIQNEGQTLQRIELIAAEENTGIPGNCNRGVNQCKGEWIKIIAGDDCLLPHCIQEFVNYANQNVATSIIYSEAELINGKGEVLVSQDNYYKSDILGWRSYFFNLSVKEQLKHYAREPFFLVTPSLFVKRKVLNEIGGFDEQIRTFEDIPFVYRCLSAGFKLESIPSKTILYRIHENAVSKHNNTSKQLALLKEFSFIYYHYRRQYLQTFNLYDLGARFEAWLHYRYTLKFGLKGERFLVRLNPYRLYKKKKAAEYLKAYPILQE